MKNKTAIVTISIGDRPWTSASFDLFEKYCYRNNIDFKVENSLPNDILDITFPEGGRNNKHVYAFKAYVVEKYLCDYERIAVIDDSCVIDPKMGNIFDEVRCGYIGAVREPENLNIQIQHHETSFNYIKEFCPTEAILFDKNYYINTGVVVYDNTYRGIFTLENIKKYKNLFACSFPHQTWTYFILQKYKCKLFELDDKFNYIPGINILTNEERSNLITIKHLLKENCICHFTGIYKNRKNLILEAVSNYT